MNRITLCPWLGMEQDRAIRHTEPQESHRCYARQVPAGIAFDHQVWYCLTDQHPSCIYYRQPSVPPLRAPELTPLTPAEDEVGPPPRFPTWRVWLWAAVAVVALVVLYYYGSALLTPLPRPTPSAIVMPSPSSSPTLTVTPTSMPVQAPNPASTGPTATPTPYPGGRIYVLTPQAKDAGWVASDEARGNHLGDSYLYTGVFDGVIYHGVFQFDLRWVPRGATIHAAVLEISGLDARRLGASGVWEVRGLAREADADWSRRTYQDVHNAPVQWSFPPALSVNDLRIGEPNAFVLSAEQIRDLEQRLLDEHYTVSFRLDGPLTGENSLFAWDTGYGPATRGHPPRLWLSVGAPPKTPIPTGSPPPTDTPTPTETPEWFVVTNTPTPANAITAAVIALRETAWATTTGTPTPLPQYVATATPLYIVVTRTPTPATYATAVYLRALATAYTILTGTPTPTPHNLATATFTPRPTRTPVYIWLDDEENTPTPTPTMPAVPSVLRHKILFLSDRSGKTEVYMLDPASGRVARLTAAWPYEAAHQTESRAPDGRAWAYVQKDGRGVLQIHVYSRYYGGSWQVTFNTGMNYDPVWSPTADRLAFVSTEEGNDDIFVIDVDGKNQHRLTINSWEWDKHPSWSPDGQQIVFYSNQGSGRRQLWIMNADGSGRRILLSSPYNDWDPVWVK